jgi:MFS family permease
LPTALSEHRPDSAYAWRRLAASVAISTIGGVGMWSVVVVLPAVQAEFGADRATASLPYTLTMLGFGAGGVLMGRLTDRFGVVPPVLAGAICLALGYAAAAMAPTLLVFALAQGLLVGALGASAHFSPLVADVSHWFQARRGLAVSIAASGNYLAGAVWPPVTQHLVQAYGWRPTLLGIGLFCLVAIPPLALVLRARPPAASLHAVPPAAAGGALPPALLQGLLLVAGVACCVAMSMPQVHIVAYCGDLGYGAARGAEMLALMLGFGIVSRVGSGFVADRIGGLATLLLGSGLQGVALLLYLTFDSLASLYVISALFGLFQGGIVSSYAVVVRENFPASEAGTRIAMTLTATLFGMALGGWLSGVLFDATGSYRAAFLNGLAWNLANVAIVGWLLARSRPRSHRPRLEGQPA